MARPNDTPELVKLRDRRDFIKKAAAGTALVALGGGLYRIASDDMTRAAQADKRRDGRPRLPPGQKVLQELRPMGGEPGSAKTEDFKLQVHGEVARPFTLSWAELLAAPRSEIVADVHCVTGWSVLGASFSGVAVAHLAERAGLLPGVRHVIFEAAAGYTANVPLAEATTPNVLVTYAMNGKSFARKHGAPARGLVPDLYFWKSAKSITGIRFVKRDIPGFWETRGYHNHADPWKEERYG